MREWDWIEAIAEERREEAVADLRNAQMVPLETEYWIGDSCTLMQSALYVAADAQDVEDHLEYARSRTRLPLRTEAAGLLTIATREVAELVWGLEVDADHCLLQYLEHKHHGSRVWCQRLDISYLPVGEWELIHVGYWLLIEPLFDFGRAATA